MLEKMLGSPHRIAEIINGEQYEVELTPLPFLEWRAHLIRGGSSGNFAMELPHIVSRTLTGLTGPGIPTDTDQLMRVTPVCGEPRVVVRMRFFESIPHSLQGKVMDKVYDLHEFTEDEKKSSDSASKQE